MLQKLADLLQLVFGCVRRTPLLNYYNEKRRFYENRSEKTHAQINETRDNRPIGRFLLKKTPKKFEVFNAIIIKFNAIIIKIKRNARQNDKLTTRLKERRRFCENTL